MKDQATPDDTADTRISRSEEKNLENHSYLHAKGVASLRSPDAPLRWNLARLCAVGTLFLVPVSTAGVNILAPLAVLLALTCRQFWNNIGGLSKHNRVALAASGLFALLGISLLWSVASYPDAAAVLLKYRKLLYFPFLLLLFDAPKWRRAAMCALGISLTCVLILSCTNWIGITHVGALYAPDPVRASWVFKNHITQGIFTAWLAYAALTLATFSWNARRAKSVAFSVPPGIKLTAALIACLALVNLFVIQQGRTGQILAPVLLLLWGWQTCLRGQRADRKKIFAALMIIAVGGGLGLAYTVHDKSSRMGQVGSEIHAYETHNESTSMGLRLEFYRRSLILISRRPIFGAGVGNVGTQFAQLTSGQHGAEEAPSSNPHNEYLLMSMQLGVVGLLVFVALLWQLWRASLRTPGLEGALSGGYVLAFGAGCLANSLLLDVSEGYFLVFLCGILLAPARSSSVGRDEK